MVLLPETVEDIPRGADWVTGLERNQLMDHGYQSDDFQELYDVFLVCIKHWAIIAFFTICASLTGIWYAVNLPNLYTASVLLSPSGGSSASGSNLMRQYSGLASLAGVNLSSMVNPSGNESLIALEVLKSHIFFSTFIIKHDLSDSLGAGIGWDFEAREIIFDAEIYDAMNAEWQSDEDGSSEPSMIELVDLLKERLSVASSDESGLVTVALQDISPENAAVWVQLLVEDLNNEMQKQAISRTQKSIDYLSVQIEKTSKAELSSVLYELMQDQMQKLMLAEITSEYSFGVIDPPVIPELKSSPNRTRIAIFSFVIGLLFGIVAAISYAGFRKFLVARLYKF